MNNLCAASAISLLNENILSFWIRLKDPEGGFFGEASCDGTPARNADRGLILNARIIWAFSAAYRATGIPAYLDSARHAFDWFMQAFRDTEHGGVYWLVDCKGQPRDTKKQLYSQAFAIYALSEYYAATGKTAGNATGDPAALEAAKELFFTIEDRFRDPLFGGYTEALSANFSPLEDMSLSEKDINADKTMNSHLHLMEAYANLYRVFPDSRVKEATEKLLDIVCATMTGPDGHLGLYFHRNWTPIPAEESCGHDIETSWLALETAETLGDESLTKRIKPLALKLAEAGNRGLDDTALLKNEWWVAAEALVGNLWLWSRHNDQAALTRAEAIWNLITGKFVDREHGEWFWRLNPDGTPDLSEVKAGFWKCPYHNSRMCLQISEILSSVRG